MANPTLIASTGGAAAYVVHADADGLSRRGRVVAWILALVLLLVGAGALYSAGAAPLTGSRVPQEGNAQAQAAAAALGTTPANGGDVASHSADGGTFVYDLTKTVLDDAIQAAWDGPTTQLDWKGDGYTTAEATFIGDRVVSPGDDVHRTLNIANAGPSDAVMSIGLLLDQNVPELAQNPDLAKDIVLFWDVSGVAGSQTFAELLDQQRAGTPVVAEIQVPMDATAAVTVGFRMDRDVTADRRLDEESTLLSFQVLAHMQGDTTTYQPPPLLTRTGVQVLGGIALAAGLLVLGWLLLAAARRRRRCDDCDRRIGRGEAWQEYHAGHGRRHVRCEECVAALGSAEPLGAGAAVPA